MPFQTPIQPGQHLAETHADDHQEDVHVAPAEGEQDVLELPQPAQPVGVGEHLEEMQAGAAQIRFHRIPAPRTEVVVDHGDDAQQVLHWKGSRS